MSAASVLIPDCEPECPQCGRLLTETGLCWGCDTEYAPKAPGFDLAAIEARWRAGTVTDADVRELIFELKHRLTTAEVITAYREAGREFDRLVGL